MKDNYSAWEVNPKEYNHKWSNIEKLKFFARFAILSPSGHNTQPWQLSTEGNTINVSINKSHYLSSDGSGLLSVEPYISIGAFIETYELAANAFGYKLNFKMNLKDKNLVNISIGKKTPANPELAIAITNRVSNRNVYSKKPLSTDEIKKITQNNFNLVKISTITKTNDKEFIATESKKAIGNIMRNPKYRNELSEWIRPNLSKKYDGMPGITHGFGLVASLIAKPAIKHIKNQSKQEEKAQKLITNTGTLFIIECKENSISSFIETGRLYARLCILSCLYGISTSGFGASVIDQSTRKEMISHFKLKYRPVVVLRAGKTNTTAPHSPRWPLEKILN